MANANTSASKPGPQKVRVVVSAARATHLVRHAADKKFLEPQIVVASTTDTTTVDETTKKAVTAKTPAKNNKDTGSRNSPGDSGLEEAGIITEHTHNGEDIATKDRPKTPGACVRVYVDAVAARVPCASMRS